jgi:hypothetical protein
MNIKVDGDIKTRWLVSATVCCARHSSSFE